MNTTGACGQFCRNNEVYNGIQGGGALSSAMANGPEKSLFDTLFMPMGEVVSYTLSIDYELLNPTEGIFVYATKAPISKYLEGVKEDDKRTVSIRWLAKKGKINVNGTLIEAYQALARAEGRMVIEVKDENGNLLKKDSEDLAKRLTDAGYTNKTNCHGLTFTGGKFWIEPNQVESLMTALGYDPTPVANPQKGDVGIYGTWKDAPHSVKVREVKNGQVTLVDSKGGVSKFMRLPPGPGTDTAWENTNDKLNYYRLKPGK